MSPDTVAAIVTPIGEAGLAAIRISGPSALEILKKAFHPASLKTELHSHLMVHGQIKRGDGKVVDEVMVVYMAAPKTYTGEEVVEVFCHGGEAVARLVLGEILSNGGRLASKGEFTKRAFLNGKIDLAQAEGVVGLVKAKTPEAVLLAEAQMEGRLSKEVRRWREGLLRLLALIEAEIDFSEELAPVDPKEIKDQLGGIIEGLDKTLKTAKSGYLATIGEIVAIVGAPNVGKSSLLNALLKEEKAIVTNVPGTTRDLVEGGVDIKGVLLKIVDTAGIRDAKDEVEKIGVARSVAMQEAAALVLLVTDGEDENKGLFAGIDPKKTILVYNKLDLWRGRGRKKIEGVESVEVSALTGEGIDQLEESIYNYFVSRHGFSLESDLILTSERHAEALKRAKEAGEKAVATLDKKISMEFMAVDIKEAVLALGEVTGEEVSEEVLNEIFSSFCVGK